MPMHTLQIVMIYTPIKLTLTVLFTKNCMLHIYSYIPSAFQIDFIGNQNICAAIFYTVADVTLKHKVYKRYFIQLRQ